jgi:protein TonB
MSPSALALAVLLHASVALAIWWISQTRPQLQPAEDPIDITFEQPKLPEPPPPPQQEAHPPAPPIELGLRPPAPLTSDKPTQVPPAPPSKEIPAPPPPPLQEAVPAPQPQPPPPTPSELALPAAPSPPVQEHALVQPPLRPPPAAPQPEHHPSPLTTQPQRRPPAAAPVEQPSQHPFVNPADAYNRARVADNYLWQVARKLSGYRYQAHVSARQGLTVVRVVIARDGRLLDVGVAQSSGVPEFDRGVIAGVRAGSPYAPLPPEIRGDRATFDLPLVSVNRQ